MVLGGWTVTFSLWSHTYQGEEREGGSATDLLISSDNTGRWTDVKLTPNIIKTNKNPTISAQILAGVRLGAR